MTKNPQSIQRYLLIAVSVVGCLALLALAGGCAGTSSPPAPSADAKAPPLPDFYVAHLQAADPIWFKPGSSPAADNPTPFKIPDLTGGVADLAVLTYTGSTDRWLYVLSAGGGLGVYKASGDSVQLVAAVPVGANPFGLAIDRGANFAYVSNAGGDSVTVVDLVANRAVQTIQLPAGSQPRGIAVTPNGKKVYVANFNTSSISVIDADSRLVVHSIPVNVRSTPAQPSRMAISPGGETVYVASALIGTGVTVIDVGTDTVSKTIGISDIPTALAVDPTGADLYVGELGDVLPNPEVQLYGTRDLQTKPQSGNPAGGGQYPISYTDAPTYLLSFALGSFLSVNQTGVEAQWGLSGAGYYQTWKVGTRPSAVAIVRQVNRTPSSPPVCSLTVTTAGNGTVSTNPSSGDGTYLCGTSVTLTATPASGQQFTSWSGDLTGNANPETLVVNGSKNVMATFAAAQGVTLTVATIPTGLQARIGDTGAYSAAPVSQSVTPNLPQTISVTDQQYLSAAGTGYRFSSWSTGATTATTTVTPAANLTATATFKTACYALTFAAAPVAGGTVTANPPAGGVEGLPSNCYAPGTIVTLTATPATGYTLQGWTNAAAGTANTAVVLMGLPFNVTANFAQATDVTLTLASSPPGLLVKIGTTGTYEYAPTSKLVPANQPQILSVPDAQTDQISGTGYVINNWSTGGTLATTTVTPAANLTVTATFKVACYPLEVTVTPAGSGTVAAIPAAGNVTGFASNCYAPGTLVTLTATPAAGKTFLNWTGSVTGTGLTAVVTMNSAKSLVATFGTPQGVTTTVFTTPVGLLARIGTTGAYAAAPVSAISPINQDLTISVLDPQFVVAAGTGYAFSQWFFAITGPLTGSGSHTATTIVGPGADLAANAVFNVACYTFTANVAPAGGGTVTLSPASGGMAGLPSNCYAPGTTVTVTATPASGYVRQGAATTAVVVNSGNSSYTANFTLYAPPVMSFAFSAPGTINGTTFSAPGVLTNMGTSAYNNVTITQIAWDFIPASVSITNATPLPAPLGNLPAGGVSQPLTISVTLPASGIPPGAQVGALISGTAVIPQTGEVVAWTNQ